MTARETADLLQPREALTQHSKIAVGAHQKMHECAYGQPSIRQEQNANIGRHIIPVAQDEVPTGMAWNPSGKPLQDYHVVIGDASQFKLQWNNKNFKQLSTGFTASSIKAADAERGEIKRENPSIKEFLEIRYREAPPGSLPQNSEWLMRDKSGKLEEGYKGQGTAFPRLDFANPQFQDRVAEQAGAAVKSGAVDGVFLDCYAPGIGGKNQRAEEKAREELIAKVRTAIGPRALIMINTNDQEAPKDVNNKVNGYYMESIDSSTPANWSKIQKTLDAAQQETLSPHFDFVETQGSRDDQAKARATATLVLTNAPGSATEFGDPNGKNKTDHGHNFFAFYNTEVGAAEGKLIKRPDGSESREYSNGTVLYNPDGNKPVEIKFATPRTEASTDKTGKDFMVNGEDGDIFLYHPARK